MPIVVSAKLRVVRVERTWLQRLHTAFQRLLTGLRRLRRWMGGRP